MATKTFDVRVTLTADGEQKMDHYGGISTSFDVARVQITPAGALIITHEDQTEFGIAPGIWVCYTVENPES